MAGGTSLDPHCTGGRFLAMERLISVSVRPTQGAQTLCNQGVSKIAENVLTRDKASFREMRYASLPSVTLLHGTRLRTGVVEAWLT